MASPGTTHELAATVIVDDKRVRHALVMMEQRLADPIPIGELAQRLQLSTRHMERLFQGVVGAKPQAVYRAMRLRHAHWMLKHTHHSITLIAIDTGFSDGAHFSRQFKQMTGVSPREARRQFGGEASRRDAASRPQKGNIAHQARPPAKGAGWTAAANTRTGGATPTPA